MDMKLRVLFFYKFDVVLYYQKTNTHKKLLWEKVIKKAVKVKLQWALME